MRAGATRGTMRPFQKQIWEPIMKAYAFMLVALALLAGLATAASPPGGPAYGYGYRPPVRVYYGGSY